VLIAGLAEHLEQSSKPVGVMIFSTHTVGNCGEP
jgi:hypothetical protein